MFPRRLKVSPGGLDDLFPFVFASVRSGAIMVIGAYFDESVREDGNASLCVGGYLFKPAQYARFRQRWHREVLRLPNRKRLRHFHMTDLCAGRGVYEGMAIEERIGVLNRAVSVVGATAYGAIGVVFDQAEYEALVDKEWAIYRGSIYAQACGLAVQVTAFWLRDWGCHNMQVMYVFEDGHKRQSEAEAMLSAYRTDEDARKQFKYRQHFFEQKDKEYGLQAADLFAWTMTKGRSINGGDIPRAFRPFATGVLRITDFLPGRQKLTQLTGPMLRRYLQEQATLANGFIEVDFGRRKRPTLR
jgi:hypothetical protein